MENLRPWIPVIGLEIHAQIATKSKLFSYSPADVFGKDQNSCVSYMDMALPGTLPVLNREAVCQGIRLGLALGGTINNPSVMERKHYFYPDNPSGYQISQFETPLVSGGQVVLTLSNQREKIVHLERIHIECDAGKSLHDQDPSQSYVDFNRCGVGLMEIVSKADMSTADEVVDYVKTLRCLMEHLGVCYGDMEKGQLRVDINLSLHKAGEPWGTRVEIKNMNSLKFIHQAILGEIERQKDILSSGGRIVQETRGFDAQRGETYSLRSKEKASDYFYFPDPDLPKVFLLEEELELLKNTLPELPEKKKERWITHYGLSAYDAHVLVQDPKVTAYFEETLGHLPTESSALPKMAANWILGEIFSTMKLQDKYKDISTFPVTPAYLASLVSLLQEGRLSQPLSKQVFGYLLEDSSKTPEVIMKERNLEQISDETLLRSWIEEVLKNNPQQKEAYKNGKTQLFGYFVGQIIKTSQGKGNPDMINKLLKEYL